MLNSHLAHPGCRDGARWLWGHRLLRRLVLLVLLRLLLLLQSGRVTNSECCSVNGVPKMNIAMLLMTQLGTCQAVAALSTLALCVPTH